LSVAWFFFSKRRRCTSIEYVSDLLSVEFSVFKEGFGHHPDAKYVERYIIWVMTPT
jgi:hypothetical protein